MQLNKKNKVIIFAQDLFKSEQSKTALGFLRYSDIETVAIVDRKCTGKNASDFFSDLRPIPIYSSVAEAKKANLHADVLLIGIAPAGGLLPQEWISEIQEAINLKLNIVNGLHEFLSTKEELNNLAKKNNVEIWDVRKANDLYPIAMGRLLDFNGNIVLTVGTDGAIGKMTVALELTKSAMKKNFNAKFIATGQTGIMISGRGIPLDAIKGDFMAGAVEQEILNVIENKKDEMVFVEGQGSILHPGWSGVTLSLLHGSLPNKLILCHKIGRDFIKDTKIPTTPLKNFIDLYERLTLPIRKAKVVGIALNTSSVEKDIAIELINKTEIETGLPCDDPFLFNGDKLLNACF